jgi:peptidoglycan/xylan/chitin deacetylase (PgdA/CDA1 family)
MRGDTLVIAYHRVSHDPRSPLEVGVAQLEGQVRALSARGYRFETVTRAVQSASAGERVAALTFDDGDPSVVELALPLLDSLGARATVFVPTGVPGRLDVEPLRDAGWEVGSHGHRHLELTSLASDDLRDELRLSRDAVLAACGACTSIAYPYSAVDRRVIDAARDAGFVVGCTTATTPAPGPLAWPRVGIGCDDGRTAFRTKTSKTGRALRRSRFGDELAAAARAARQAAHRLRHR